MNQPDNSLVPFRPAEREAANIVTILRLDKERCSHCGYHHDSAVVQFDGCPDRRLLCWQCIRHFCTVINSLRYRL